MHGSRCRQSALAVDRDGERLRVEAPRGAPQASAGRGQCQYFVAHWLIFQALDLRTGEASWRPRLRVPYNTAALTTGGGLVFIGDWGRRVHAYDR